MATPTETNQSEKAVNTLVNAMDESITDGTYNFMEIMRNYLYLEISSGNLTSGVTYTCVNDGGGGDFSNLGGDNAPSAGDQFTLTSSGAPNGWGTSILCQSYLESWEEQGDNIVMVFQYSAAANTTYPITVTIPKTVFDGHGEDLWGTEAGDTGTSTIDSTTDLTFTEESD